MRYSIAWTALFVTAVNLLLPATRAPAQEDNTLAAAHAACIAFQANCAELKTYKCRYTYTKANAANPEKALLGEYTNVRRCEFLLVVDGEQRKYQSTTPLNMLPPRNVKGERAGGGGIKTTASSYHDFIPIAELSLGAEGLNYTADWKTAKLNSKDEPHPQGGLETPLSIIRWDVPLGLPRLLSLKDQGRVTLRSRGLVQIDRRPTIHADFELTAGDKTRFEFFFDAEKGYLPCRLNLHYIAQEPKVEIQTCLLEAKDVGKKRWFPMHIVKLDRPEITSNSVNVVDIRVTELVVDKVTDDDLSLDIPAGTVITWQDPAKHNLEYFRLRQNEKISPIDIPRLQAMLGRSKSEPLMDTAVKTYPEGSSTKWYLIGSGVVLLGASVIAYRRYRLRSA